jgi:CheY-like chemotaxis protein
MDTPTPTLLLVDDEAFILTALKRLLRRDGYQVLTAVSGQAGLDILANTAVDVIVSDQRMPGMSGVEFLRRAKQVSPQSVRMVLSGYTELQSVTDAINEGSVYKFMTKPWDDDMLRANIAEAFRQKGLEDDNLRLQAELAQTHRSLLTAHEQLSELAQEQRRRLAQDQVLMEVSHEVMDALPIPVLGVDDEGLVVLINTASQRGFPEAIPGVLLQEIPALASLCPEVTAFETGSSRHLGVDGVHWTVHCARMGAKSRARGWLLTFLPTGDTPP